MIKITPAAAEQMKKSFASADENTVLRIAVRQKENGDFHYLMGLDEPKPGDTRYLSQEIQIAVADDQNDLLDNMEIDFVEISQGKLQFIFKNPNDPKFKQPAE